MKLHDLKGQTIAFAGSGGLDSCTITRWLTEEGVKVVCYTADLAQPDETDFAAKYHDFDAICECRSKRTDNKDQRCRLHGEQSSIFGRNWAAHERSEETANGEDGLY